MPEPQSPRTVSRVLLVRLGALGDIVHGIPVAAALRRAYPAAHIDWLVASKRRAILDLVPVINRRLAVGPGMSWILAIRELRRARYDVVLDLQGLLKSAVLARSSGAPRVIGFSSRYLRERLALPFYTEVHEPRAVHVVWQNLALIEPLGIRVVTPEFPIEQVASEAARQVSARAGGHYVLLNPCAAWPNKRWPSSRFGAVAAALRKQHGLESAVLWGPGERPLADEVVASSGGAAFVSPPTSVADLVALARGAALMISGDTGPTHIAAAVGTPIVGIYGPTRPWRNGPWSPHDVTVSRDGICRCHHVRRCRLETMCLMDVQVEEVLEAVERRLLAESTRVSGSSQG